MLTHHHPQIAQLRDEIASNDAAAQMDKSTIKQAYKDLKKQLRGCEADLDHTRSDLAQATARVNDVGEAPACPLMHLTFAVICVA